MASDNRDWYRDWWRKKTGYVERARFRIGEGEFVRQKQARAWRRNWLLLAVIVGILVAVRWLLKR